MKNLCNLLIVAELQIIIKAVFAKLFRMLALLLTLCANKVVCSTQTQCDALWIKIRNFVQKIASFLSLCVMKVSSYLGFDSASRKFLASKKLVA